MNRGLQTLCYLVAFVGALLFGALFNEVFWQVSIHARIALGDKPLPIPTQFFVDHRHLPIYLALIPWIALVGLPLLPGTRAQDYWDPTAFLLRYAAFVTVEAFLFAVLYLSSLMHFLPRYMSFDTKEYDAIESVVRFSFWALTILVVMGMIRRVKQGRERPRSNCAGQGTR